MKLATSKKSSTITEMADSLVDKVKDRSIPNNAQVNPNHNTANAVPDSNKDNAAKAGSIDDILEQREDGLYYKNPNSDSLDEKLKLDKKTGFWGKAWDVVKYSPILAAQFALFGPMITLSTAITATGFTIGGYFEAKKQGKKFTWRRKRRELYSGNIFGFLDYVIYKVPEYFGNFIPFLGGASLAAKIAKVLFFDLTVIPAAVAAYKSVEYVRDEIGFGKFFKSFFTLGIFKRIKEIYKNAIKGQMLKNLLPIYAIAPFLHYPQLHMLPNVQARMAQAAFLNNPIFRYIVGRNTIKDRQKADSSELENKVENEYQKTPGEEYKPQGPGEPETTTKPEKKEPGLFRKYLIDKPKNLYRKLNDGFDKYIAGGYRPNYSRR